MRFKSSNSAEKDIKDLVNRPENANRCGECGHTFPTWASVNLGVFLCGRCASVHRKVLSSEDQYAYSYVKSLTIDRWSHEDIEMLAHSGGNLRNRDFWNPKKVPFPYDGDQDRGRVEHWVRDKYVLGRFKYDEVRPEDFHNTNTMKDSHGDRYRSERGGSYGNNDDNRDNVGYGRPKSARQGEDYNSGRRSVSAGNRDYDNYGYGRSSGSRGDDYGRSRSKSYGDGRDAGYDNESRGRNDSNRQRSQSTSSKKKKPQITGRMAKDFEMSQYSRQLNELNNMGFTNVDNNAEALSLSNGDIGNAVALLDSYKQKKSKQEKKYGTSSNTSNAIDDYNPSLPNRPKRQQPKPAVFDGTDPEPATFDGTVQQYVDPATGIVYVDQNDYAMAMQQQQQQMPQIQVLQGQPLGFQTTGITVTQTGVPLAAQPLAVTQPGLTMGMQAPLNAAQTGFSQMEQQQVVQQQGSVDPYTQMLMQQQAQAQAQQYAQQQQQQYGQFPQQNFYMG